MNALCDATHLYRMGGSAMKKSRQWGLREARHIWLRLAPALTLAGLLISQQAASQQAAGDAQLAEIVVTAQKREQRAQDVGISMTDFTSAQLRAMALTGTADIAQQTPSMKVNSFSPSLTIFNIRGVSQNDFADHYEPPIAVFVDDAYVSAQGAVDTQMLDLERVEVLRGPQGTLFGRNAIGGIIQYITKKPSDTFDAYADLTLGSFSQKKFDGAVGGPLSDWVDARLAIAGDYYDGWVKDLNGPALNDSNSYSYRGQLLIKATDDLKVLLNVHGIHNNDTAGGNKNRALFVNADGLGQAVPSNVNYYGTCNGCDPRGYRDSPDPWTVDHYYPGLFNRRLVGTTATVTWNPGPFTVTSISDYYSLNKLYAGDSSASPFPLLSYLALQDLHQLSQELRINGEADHLHWVTGAYYIYINAKQDNSTTVFAVNPEAIDYSVKTRSPAVFGQVDFDFAPGLTGIAGVRYTEDHKVMNYVRTGGGIFAGEDIFNPSTDPTAEQTFKNYSAKLEVDWKPIEHVMLYGAFNRGTKGGDFSAPILPPVIPANLPHKSEVLYDYEVGVKSTLANGRVTVNADVFYYDYRDYQAFSFTNLVESITNVDANIKGTELEIHAKPIESLELAFGASRLEGTTKDIKLPSGRITDRDMPMTPPFTVNGLVKYSWSAGPGKLSLQADGNYSSHFYWNVLNPPQSYEPGYFIGNARVSYTPTDGPWEASFAVRNVGDKHYRVSTGDFSALGYGLDWYGPPRWYSVSMMYRWH
jgi:iron complex outermembrane receptor protein